MIPAEIDQIEVGKTLDVVRPTKKWEEATIVEVDGDSSRMKIHYTSEEGDHYDEWLPFASPRLEPWNTKVGVETPHKISAGRVAAYIRRGPYCRSEGCNATPYVRRTDSPEDTECSADDCEQVSSNNLFCPRPDCKCPVLCIESATERLRDEFLHCLRASSVIGQTLSLDFPQELNDEEKEDELKFNLIKDEMMARKATELKELLKHNDLQTSGSKDTLSTRIADAKLYGAIGKCPQCEAINVKVVYSSKWGHGGQGKWFCPGYYDDDEFVECSWREDEFDRTPWKNIDGEKSELLSADI